MTAAVWMVVLTFMFPGFQGTRIAAKPCSDQACINILLDLAYQDPAVVRIQVFDPGTFAPTKETGQSISPAARDEWKS